ncbi:MAG: GFA family protein [Gammaproteobacteria bacterium]|nr:GFA family protein [Gammaproteobacteria bacterium]
MKVFQYCHCSRCRKFTGSAHAANIIIDPENFRWLGGETSAGRFYWQKPDILPLHYATGAFHLCPG